MEKEPRDRRRFDSCRFVSFWHRWGPHLDFSGGLMALGMLATILWDGFGFVHDTRAANTKVYEQATSIALVTSRIDRIDGNIQIIMNDRNLKPLKKTPTEIILEKNATKTFVDETQATDDND